MKESIDDIKSKLNVDLTESDKLLSLTSSLLRNVDSKFSSNCEKLLQIKLKIYPLLASHDYSTEIKGNGYRSSIKFVDKFTNLIYNNLKSNSFKKVDPTLSKMCSIICRVFESFIIPIDSFRFQTLDWKQASLNHFNLFFELDHDLSCFYGSYQNFWLTTTTKTILKYYLYLVVFLSTPFTKIFKLFDSKYRVNIFADFSCYTSVYFVRKVWSLSELYFYRSLLPTVLYTTKPYLKQTTYIPKQTTVIVNPVTLFAQIEPQTDFDFSQNVRCRILQKYQFRSSPKDSLIIHFHGAGFVAQSPDSHEVYLRDWAIKLPNVPIISVDYRLSPEARHPSALQDGLDVYLWLVSGHPSVVDMIGFHPKNIILCGDSAGGYISVAISMILSDLNEMKIEKIIMPIGIISFYGVCSMKPTSYASQMFAFFDTFLPIGVLLSVIDAFHREEEKSTISNDDSHCGFKDISKTSFRGPHSFKPPWYRGPKFLTRLSQLYRLSNHPYVSFDLFKGYSKLSKVSLSIIIGEFDPLLDGNIQLAKMWKGPTKLDILPDLTHGFLYFAKYTKESEKATELCLQRIVECLDL